VGPRFELELSAKPGSGRESLGSRLITCYTITKPNFRYVQNPPKDDDEDEDSFEEGTPCFLLHTCFANLQYTTFINSSNSSSNMRHMTENSICIEAILNEYILK
jgi:hypothetical protein